MISCACGRRSIGKTRANRSWSSSHPPAICGVSEDVAQVSMTSGSPTNPPGRPRCPPCTRQARRSSGSTGRRILVREERVVVVGGPVSSSGYHTGNGDAEEPLPAECPVAVQALDPRGVARAHVGGMPTELAPALEQLVAELDRLHEPLAARDHLEGSFPSLVELHRRGGRVSALRRGARLAQELGDPLARLLRRPPRELRMARDRLLGVRATPNPARPTAAARSCRRAGTTTRAWEAQLAPPRHVGDVAERADHRDARSPSPGRQARAPRSELGAEQRGHGGRADEDRYRSSAG